MIQMLLITVYGLPDLVIGLWSFAYFLITVGSGVIWLTGDPATWSSGYSGRKVDRKSIRFPTPLPFSLSPIEIGPPPPFDPELERPRTIRSRPTPPRRNPENSIPGTIMKA